jgi:hypothetical protein
MADNSIGNEDVSDEALVLDSKSKARHLITQARKRKTDVSLDEMRSVVKLWMEIDTTAYFTNQEIRKKHQQILKDTDAMTRLDKRYKKLKTEERKVAKEITSVETQRNALKSVVVSVKDPKLVLRNSIYSKIPRETTAYAGDGTGGAYAHLTNTSLEKIFQAMREHTGFNRTSTLVDIGGGLNVPALHAATAHCHFAVGIEIEADRVLEASSIMLQYCNEHGNGMRNHRVALINADVLTVKPVEYAAYGFAFDLAFSPSTYLDVIDWVANSTIEYFVTFKPAREPTYLSHVLETLHAVEVARLPGMVFAFSQRKCTAIILKRERIPRIPLVAGQSGGDDLIDSHQLMLPFVSGTLKQTMDCYEKLMADIRDSKGRSGPLTRTKKQFRDKCLVDDWVACTGSCAKCRSKLKPIPVSFLEVTASSVEGQGLFTTVALESDTVLAEYTGSDVKNITPLKKNAEGKGVHQWVNHSCAPNSRFVEIVDAEGRTRMHIVTSEALADGTEITVDYGQESLASIECGCASPFCRQRSKVLFLGMVQYSTQALREMLCRAELASIPTGKAAVVTAALTLGQLSVQHARDTFRCITTAETCGVSVFTMDHNQSNVNLFDSDCHFITAFDNRNVINTVKGSSHDVTFSQIVLDYYFSPVSWAREHWTEPFFTSTLPQFAEHDVLQVGGTIILPFQPHVLNLVAKNEKKLAAYYTISVCYKGSLQDITLWKGTMASSKDTMVQVFEKALDQEEIYCVVTTAMLYGDAVKRFGSDPRLGEARFLCLKRLAADSPPMLKEG